MEEHGVVPDVIDTAPTDELEVSVMNVHCTLNGTVYCCKFLLWRWKHYGVLKRWWPSPGLIMPLSSVAWWCGAWKTQKFVRMCPYCLLLQGGKVNTVLLDLEDGCSRFIWHIGAHPPDYTLSTKKTKMWNFHEDLKSQFVSEITFNLWCYRCAMAILVSVLAMNWLRHKWRIFLLYTGMQMMGRTICCAWLVCWSPYWEHFNV